MANGFAHVALFAWPVVAILIFWLFRPERAAVVSIVAGYLLLPSGFSIDVDFFPPVNKANVIVLSSLVLCLIKCVPSRGRPLGVLLSLLILAFVIGPIGTGIGNAYELQFGDFSYPAFALIDGIKQSVRNLIPIGAFYIGYRYLSSNSGRLTLLTTLVFAAILYTVPMLFEVRFSPQLHAWVYGYHPGEFQNTMRAGGFRPVVFLQNGIQLALFITMALLAASTIMRARLKIFTGQTWAIFLYLIFALLLCRTLSAFIYACLLVPVICFLRPRIWVTLASAMLLLVCVYPAMRSADLVPIDNVMNYAEQISEDRARSLSARLTNEQMLLAKANEKPVFGWGGWGRNRIFDARSGKDLSITDGGWIITLGIWGWFGYLALFGLLTVPVLRLGRSLNRRHDADALVAAGLAIILAANVIDMIPNANLSPITFLIAGSLAGFARMPVNHTQPARVKLKYERARAREFAL